MAHIRQSRPDSGLGLQVTDLEIFEVVPTLRPKAPPPFCILVWVQGLGLKLLGLSFRV